MGCRCQYKEVVDWCGCSPNVFTNDYWIKLEVKMLFTEGIMCFMIFAYIFLIYIYSNIIIQSYYLKRKIMTELAKIYLTMFFYISSRDLKIRISFLGGNLNRL